MYAYRTDHHLRRQWPSAPLPERLLKPVLKPLPAPPRTPHAQAQEQEPPAQRRGSFMRYQAKKRHFALYMAMLDAVEDMIGREAAINCHTIARALGISFLMADTILCEHPPLMRIISRYQRMHGRNRPHRGLFRRRAE